jgi:hypothetical protein
MHLEATPGGVETLAGLAHVESPLANLKIQLKDTTNTKFMHDHVWCTTCHLEGHRRDKFLVLLNYVETGVSSPFPYGYSEWCEIFR